MKSSSMRVLLRGALLLALVSLSAIPALPAESESSAMPPSCELAWNGGTPYCISIGGAECLLVFINDEPVCVQTWGP